MASRSWWPGPAGVRPGSMAACIKQLESTACGQPAGQDPQQRADELRGCTGGTQASVDEDQLPHR